MKIYSNDNDYGQTIESKRFVAFWGQVLNEHIREFRYQAGEADLVFGLAALSNNLDFTWNGYNDSMPAFVNESLKRVLDMKNHNVENHFKLVKEKTL